MSSEFWIQLAAALGLLFLVMLAAEWWLRRKAASKRELEQYRDAKARAEAGLFDDTKR